MPRRLRAALVAGALCLPVIIGGFTIRERVGRDGARVFDQVMSLVSDRFVDTLDASALYEKAARGLVKQLNDPYSELFSPTELKRFSSQSSGRYGGIGMQIEDQDGSIVVVHVFSHSPAQTAGVQPGDGQRNSPRRCRWAQQGRSAGRFNQHGRQSDNQISRR